MGRRQKIPECECAACAHFRRGWYELEEGFGLVGKYFQPETRAQIEQFIAERSGCDFCGQNWQRIPNVPQVIKDFLGIENFCELCRSRMEWLQCFEGWPICWGATPDDEIKWFLIAFIMEQFKGHFERGKFILWLDCCVDGAHARRLPVKPERVKSPWEVEWEQEPVEDLDFEITLKPRVRARVIDVDVTT